MAHPSRAAATGCLAFCGGVSCDVLQGKAMVPGRPPGGARGPGRRRCSRRSGRTAYSRPVLALLRPVLDRASARPVLAQPWLLLGSYGGPVVAWPGSLLASPVLLLGGTYGESLLAHRQSLLASTQLFVGRPHPQPVVAHGEPVLAHPRPVLAGRACPRTLVAYAGPLVACPGPLLGDTACRRAILARSGTVLGLAPLPEPVLARPGALLDRPPCQRTFLAPPELQLALIAGEISPSAGRHRTRAGRRPSVHIPNHPACGGRPSCTAWRPFHEPGSVPSRG